MEPDLSRTKHCLQRIFVIYSHTREKIKQNTGKKRFYLEKEGMTGYISGLSENAGADARDALMEILTKFWTA